MAESEKTHRVVIVGAGFAGFNAARELVQLVGATTEVVVIGAGYTCTEVTAQGQLVTAWLAGRMPGLAGQPISWMLLDTAPRLLPDLDPRLSKTADRVLAAARGGGAHRPPAGGGLRSGG